MSNPQGQKIEFPKLLLKDASMWGVVSAPPATDEPKAVAIFYDPMRVATGEAAHRLALISAEVMDAAIAGLLAELPDVPPPHVIRLGWRHTFRRLFHRAAKAIHDRAFRGFCDHDGCYY